MSYGLKYFNEFKNYYDETVRIEILGRDFAGTATEVKTLATPLIVSYPGNDRELYNPIIGSQVTINLLSETNFQFIDLHNSDARAHRVDIYKETVLFWRGWLLPDLFSEPYVAPPYEVSITARCGLGELKEIPFPETIQAYTQSEPDGTEVTFANIYSIICQALRQIETDLDLNDCINVYSNENDEELDSPLPQTYVNVSMYSGKNYYEVITDILLTYGARLYQMDCEWWVVRIKEVAGTMVTKKTDLVGTFISLDNTKVTAFQIGRPAGSQIVNNSPQLDINPAWKQFNWVQDLGKKDSIFLNSKFEKWVEYPVTVRNTNWRITKWIEPEYGFLRRFIESNGDYFAQFGSAPDSAKFIYQTLNVVQSVNQTVLFKFVFDVLSQFTGIDEGRFKFEIKITGQSETQYLRLNTANDFEWVTSQNYILVQDIIPTYQGGRYSRNSSNANWKTYEFQTSGFPIDGELTFTIFGCTTITILRLKEASIILINGTNKQEFYDNDLITNVIINQNNVYEPEDIKVVGGDLPDVTNEVLIWENGYRDSAGDATHVWHERGSSIELPLLQLIGIDYGNIFQLPQFKLSVPILSQSIKFDSCIVDYLVLPKKYICGSAEIDMQTCIFSGTYIEFSAWDGSPWILETGYWNDEGIWIDEETWKDDDTDVIEINLSNPTLDGYFNITTATGIVATDVIETLPLAAPLGGDELYEDLVKITSVPHTFTGTDLYFRMSLFHTGDYSVSFKATLNGVLKTIKLNIEI